MPTWNLPVKRQSVQTAAESWQCCRRSVALNGQWVPCTHSCLTMKLHGGVEGNEEGAAVFHQLAFNDEGRANFLKNRTGLAAMGDSECSPEN